MRPNPVFELNRIVALSYAEGPEAALERLGLVGAVLASYQPYRAVCADILARLGKVEPAREAYDKAIEMSGTEAERAYLAKRREGLEK